MICATCLKAVLDEDSVTMPTFDRINAAITIFRGEAVCLPCFGEALQEEELT